ncbi:hypothetical protein GA0111570_105309 [Raineyella antarctica]|uniref:Uncharacterized protein n=1 Tax=Raineyella antarctica TaxID=1577474 RepID=A0A1G6GZ98_9ACTN|nr:hypothetical protein [Raineyella antarctica]SDB87228.1 hypothetical protein GA0111570_105309 [Raineyella antarctica]
MTLEEQVHAELRALRKSAEGVTPAGLAASPIICQLIGAGNPDIAYNALKQAILAMDQSTAIGAASASLGLAAHGSTHLERLTDFGLRAGYDQRQVRRYSDKGLHQIAAYLSTQWTLEASPQLRLSLWHPDHDHVWVSVMARHFYFIEMRTPEVSLWRDDQRDIQALSWRNSQSGAFDVFEGAALFDLDEQFVVSVIWHGELWPLFEVDIAGVGERDITARSLGSHVQVALTGRAEPPSGNQ